MALRWPDRSAEVLDTPKQHLWTTRGSSTLARFRNLLLKRSAMTGLSRASDGNARIFLGRNFHKSNKLMAKERRNIAKKVGTDFRRRYRRAEGDDLSQQDRTRREYERRLIESLHIIGYVQATRLYVREDPKLVPVGTVVGKVRKLHPYGKVKIVWPYEEFRNFSLNADTGEVTTTALMDFELIRMYNMTIRDFQYNFTDDQPYIQPPKPDPPSSKYVDHYLIVEVWDINDNPPRFDQDIGGTGQFSGKVNKFARAGTEILFLRPTDDDTGPRGRISFNIVTEGQEETPFTIDPQTHRLKTSGRELEEGRYDMKIEALDYGMPPKTSNVQPVSVYVEKTPPEFVGIPYNLNFSEAHVRGSVVATVKALSRSGMPMTYEIDDEEAKNTFAINNLGEITLLRELDFDTASETDKRFQFTVTGQEDADEGLSRKVRVNLNLVNADDHLGMFKTPATKIRVKEGGSATGGDVFVVEVEDCDCERNCLCGSKEMIFTLGDTNGFFDITDDGQIRNIKALDYEAQNYFFFPVNVTDPGTNGRTRTSYIEVYVEDDDDTPPKFRFNEYKFFIFEDAPKDQIVGVAQAVDPDPSTKPDEVTYRIITATPNTGRQYFAVINQGVIRVNENRDQFGSEDKYELVIEAIDNLRVSDPTATVIIRILDVNDHRPVFSNCGSQKIKENQPIGTVITTLTATDHDRGLNKLIEYSIQKVQKNNYFAMNSETGVVTTTHVLDRESFDDIFVTAKATDGGSGRSEALREVGYCQFTVQIEDVNDHHPEFTVAVFEVSVKRDLAAGSEVLKVEAVDPDLGDNAIIEYKILTQKDERDRNADFFQVDKISGTLSVKSSLQTLALQAKISVVVQAVNTKPVVGPNANADAQSKTTVVVSFTDRDPPRFQNMKYTIVYVKEDV